MTSVSPETIHDTFTIERRFPQSPNTVFAAFSHPATKRRWFADGHSQIVDEYSLDFRVGGREVARYRMSDATPFPGLPLVSDGVTLDIVPGRRIISAATMTLGDRPISAALATFEFLPDGSGTKLLFTHQAAFFEGSDGPAMRKQGWTAILDQLAQAL
ncbi:MAG: SRPBCC family protein [Bryobacteraceae bacterium]|nr:SRPBCC family protein [Bryobacteraceae bacterium]